MDTFKVPAAIPQDLLLIQELIGPQDPIPEAPKATPEVHEPRKSEDEDINSSDDENVSEEEIAADLITGANTDDDEVIKSERKPLSDSTSETSSDDSDSDSDSDISPGTSRIPPAELDIDDDEDPVPAAASGTYFQTKHEVQEVELPVPEVDEVSSEEILEKVGEIMNIIDKVAIVSGLAAPLENGYPVRGSDRALDSDTLLVFDDRKVMGYIYETFGPTSQPLYQVKFSATFPLDPERVRVGREVFHVPARSRFVFVNQIKQFKGSDASNVHDEEPADDELEFSDDEAEAAYRSRLKRKRGESRARSTAPSSRASTPNPTLMRDQELADEAFLGRGAYDEHGPYDIDYTMPGPSSRPAPIPYDDPYGDDYTAPDIADREAAARTGHDVKRSFDHSGGRGQVHEGQGRGRDRDRGRGGRGRDRDGGRGGGRGRGDRGGRGDRPPRQNQHQYGRQDSPADSYGSYDTRGQSNRSLSPTSAAIARATGQAPSYSQPAPYQQQQQQQIFHPQQQQQHQYAEQQYNMFTGDLGGANARAQTQQFMPLNAYMQAYQALQAQQHAFADQSSNQGSQSGYGGFSASMLPTANAFGGVQPHINPRFASAFGLGIPQGQAYGTSTSASGAAPTSTPAPSSSVAVSASSSEWTVPMVHSGSSTPIPGPTPPNGEAN